MNRPLVISAFPFGCTKFELDILDIHLNELDDVVDYFCIVESTYTQTRKEKPLYFQENKTRFDKFLPKIVYSVIDETATGFGWEQEHYIRNSLLKCLDDLREKKEIKLQLTDYLLLGDCDEVIHAEKLKEVIATNPDEPLSFNSRFIYFKLDLHCPTRGWWGPTLVSLGDIQQKGWIPQTIRNQKDFVKKIGIWDEEFWGWHFSSIYPSFDGIWSKWHNTIEPSDKLFLYKPGNKEKYEKDFNRHVLKDKFFFFSDDPQNTDIKLEKLDFSLLPRYVQENKEKFKNLLLSEEENINLSENI